METVSYLPNSENSTATIVIIDDDGVQLEMLARILTKEGYRVVGFNDGTSAVDYAAQHAPDIVLSDVIMPDMDGFEVVRRLKENPLTESIPIILMTASQDQHSESRGLDLGAVDYIHKPLAAPIVKARVRAHLELKRHRDDLECMVRQRTEELESSRKQFQDLVEKSLVGIAIIQEQRVLYQNPELKRIISGLTEKISLKDLSFVHPEDVVIVEQAYNSLKSGGNPYVEVDIRVIDPHRTHTTWINCRGCYFNYQGKRTILINVVNITHTKELERLLLMRNKMTSLGRIASGMAHEIRNPLTGITSYLYTLEQMCTAETFSHQDIGLMREILTQLNLAAHKVDAVIKRVLDFAKPTAPRMVLIDMNQCLDNVMKLTAVTLRKAGIDVSAQPACDALKCYGDMGLIEQVLLNLVQNAANAVRSSIRHSGEKQQIRVRAFTCDHFICVTIEDSGGGVPQELREKIFDPFFTTGAEGSGIGLSIAQRIVSDHNGDLSVHDSDLGGACFRIAIPVEKRKFKR
jgi:signal transduction histidine kinase/DNA-binding response OmpR family regulator